MGQLDGRVALVTGGGRGIGRGISELLAAEGAAVAVNYRRDKDAALATVDAITAAGGTGRAYQASVDDAEQDARMVDAAHASQYHWREAGGPPATRGEWLVSHVYAVLGRPEPALHHARRCLELAGTEPGVADFDHAYAAEAMARALACAGDLSQAAGWHSRATAAGATVADEEDRKIFTEVAQEAAAKATAEIKANEGKLVDFFKQKGLTVTEVNKDEFRDTVLKNVTFESFGYRKADWERIQAVK